MQLPSPTFEELLALLKIERDEDFRQYRELFLQQPIETRRKNGFTWYPITIKEDRIGFGELLHLTIERNPQQAQNHQFGAGKNAELFQNNGSADFPSINGTIKHVSENTLELVISEDELPDWAYDGKLGVNLLFDDLSYKEMEQALRTVLAAGTKERLGELRQILSGEKKPTFRPLNQPIRFHNELNERQQAAVTQIMEAQDVALVHGPPGTGKTTTLVEAIFQKALQGEKILVCAPSNTAVDLLTEKLTQAGLFTVRIGNPVRVSEEVLSATLEAHCQKHPEHKNIKSYRKKAEEFRSIAVKYKRSFGKAEREQRNLLFAEVRMLIKDAQRLENAITQSVLANAAVITSTLTNANNRLLRGTTFDTVFIDEAAQALEPGCWIPIIKADKVVFAGDHQQLPPTIKSKVASAKGLAFTLFEKNMHPGNQPIMLEEQYRMHDAIMGFSNQEFYHNKLIASATVSKHTLGFYDADLDVPIEFIDTAGCNFEESLNTETLSTGNIEEVKLLFTYLQQLCDHIPNTTDPFPSIGIMAPYKEQVKLLREYYTQHPLMVKKLPISIHSIDGFQGQERDMIFITMVRSNDNAEIGFLNDYRRMNVALTRARKKLVIIGDSATIGKNPFYSRLLAYIETNGKYRSAWEFAV